MLRRIFYGEHGGTLLSCSQ